MTEQQQQQQDEFHEPKQEDLGEAQKQQEAPQPEQEQPQESDRQLNYQIPFAVAKISFPHDEKAAQQYINTTGPILDLIEFHSCLGPMGNLPPVARLIIGSAVIVGGVVVMKIGQGKRRKRGNQKKDTPVQERGNEKSDRIVREKDEDTDEVRDTEKGKTEQW